MARRNFDTLSPRYAARIERTIGRAAYEAGQPLHAARGQRIERSRQNQRRAANRGLRRTDYDWRPAESTLRSWRRVARSNGVPDAEIDYEIAARGAGWVGDRVAAIRRFRLMAVEDGPDAAEYMVDQYIEFREIDVDKSWFFYGTQ